MNVLTATAMSGYVKRNDESKQGRHEYPTKLPNVGTTPLVHGNCLIRLKLPCLRELHELASSRAKLLQSYRVEGMVKCAPYSLEAPTSSRSASCASGTDR